MSVGLLPENYLTDFDETVNLRSLNMGIRHVVFSMVP